MNKRRSCRRLRVWLLPFLVIFSPVVASACPNCATSRTVWSEIMTHSPGWTLGILTFAFVVVAGLIVFSAWIMPRSRLLFGGALLLGAGLGAFLDGTLLHQVLQWHAMLSSVVEPLELVSSKVNMFWDGIFHLYAWLATVVAVAILVRELPQVPPEGRSQTVGGGALAGWGFFNGAEGLLDHHVFGLHHVHPGNNELLWDVGFLVFGALLIVLGFSIALRALRDKDRYRPAPDGHRPSGN